MPLSSTNNRLWFWRGDKNISIACVFLSWQLMWKDLWDCRPVRSGHESAWRFIALKHFKIKTAILVIWHLLFISLYCVRVMQCAQGWRTTSVFFNTKDPLPFARSISAYCSIVLNMIFYNTASSLFFSWQRPDKHPFSRSWLSSRTFLSTFMFPGVRDQQPPPGARECVLVTHQAESVLVL